MKVITVIASIVVTTLCLSATNAVRKFVYCKYCGIKFNSVSSLTANACQRHPEGPGKGRHALYEGNEKPSYVCKFCGKKAADIRTLTGSKCQRHPKGPAKGYHEPAL